MLPKTWSQIQMRGAKIRFPSIVLSESIFGNVWEILYVQVVIGSKLSKVEDVADSDKRASDGDGEDVDFGVLCQTARYLDYMSL